MKMDKDEAPHRREEPNAADFKYYSRSTVPSQHTSGGSESRSLRHNRDTKYTKPQNEKTSSFDGKKRIREDIGMVFHSSEVYPSRHESSDDKHRSDQASEYSEPSRHRRSKYVKQHRRKRSRYGGESDERGGEGDASHSEQRRGYSPSGRSYTRGSDEHGMEYRRKKRHSSRVEEYEREVDEGGHRKERRDSWKWGQRSLKRGDEEENDKEEGWWHGKERGESRPSKAMNNSEDKGSREEHRDEWKGQRRGKEKADKFNGNLDKKEVENVGDTEKPESGKNWWEMAKPQRIRGKRWQDRDREASAGDVSRHMSHGLDGKMTGMSRQMRPPGKGVDGVDAVKSNASETDRYSNPEVVEEASIDESKANENSDSGTVWPKRRMPPQNGVPFHSFKEGSNFRDTEGRITRPDGGASVDTGNDYGYPPSSVYLRPRGRPPYNFPYGEYGNMGAGMNNRNFYNPSARGGMKRPLILRPGPNATSHYKHLPRPPYVPSNAPPDDNSFLQSPGHSSSDATSSVDRIPPGTTPQAAVSSPTQLASKEVEDSSNDTRKLSTNSPQHSATFSPKLNDSLSIHSTSSKRANETSLVRGVGGGEGASDTSHRSPSPLDKSSSNKGGPIWRGPFPAGHEDGPGGWGSGQRPSIVDANASNYTSFIGERGPPNKLPFHSSIPPYEREASGGTYRPPGEKDKQMHYQRPSVNGSEREEDRPVHGNAPLATSFPGGPPYPPHGLLRGAAPGMPRGRFIRGFMPMENMEYFDGMPPNAPHKGNPEAEGSGGIHPHNIPPSHMGPSDVYWQPRMHAEYNNMAPDGKRLGGGMLEPSSSMPHAPNPPPFLPHQQPPHHFRPAGRPPIMGVPSHLQNMPFPHSFHPSHRRPLPPFQSGGFPELDMPASQSAGGVGIPSNTINMGGIGETMGDFMPPGRMPVMPYMNARAHLPGGGRGMPPIYPKHPHMPGGYHKTGSIGAVGVDTAEENENSNEAEEFNAWLDQEVESVSPGDILKKLHKFIAPELAEAKITSAVKELFNNVKALSSTRNGTEYEEVKRIEISHNALETLRNMKYEGANFPSYSLTGDKPGLPSSAVAEYAYWFTHPGEALVNTYGEKGGPLLHTFERKEAFNDSVDREAFLLAMHLPVEKAEASGASSATLKFTVTESRDGALSKVNEAGKAMLDTRSLLAGMTDETSRYKLALDKVLEEQEDVADNVKELINGEEKQVLSTLIEVEANSKVAATATSPFNATASSLSGYIVQPDVRC